MAFFFTMPISRMMPMMAMTRELRVREHQRQQRAHARRRQRGENGDGMNVAFVEDAEHEVNRNERGGDQEGLAAQRILIGLRGSGETGVNGRRASRSCWPLSVMASTASPSATPGCRLNEMVTDGNRPW